MKLFVCRKCGHEVLAKEKPLPMKWTDGHECHFYEDKTPENESDSSYSGKCCRLAERINCVCTAAYKCPIHGTRHMGSHD